MEIDHEKILKTDTLGRVRTSRERCEAILEDFDRSGMSGAAYARRHGINYSTFASWVQRRRRRQQGGSGTMELTLAEVMVQRTPSSAPGVELRVELPGGASLVIGDAAQTELAARLIEQLDSK